MIEEFKRELVKFRIKNGGQTPYMVSISTEALREILNSSNYGGYVCIGGPGPDLIYGIPFYEEPEQERPFVFRFEGGSK